MNATTKTGLLASPRKVVPPRRKKTIDLMSLLPCAITRRAPMSLKPFAGLYNPYSKCCSVLCNHPCGNEMKNVVKQAKNAWALEGKALMCTKEQLKTGKLKNDFNKNSDIPEHVPEEFFRRYTCTDSRPLTPTPTVASGRTRNSAIGSHLNHRRCVTPEPISSNDGQERKQIILDLRRSHSQETLYWNASSELSPRQQESISSSWLQAQNKIVIETEEITKSAEIEDIAEIDEFDEEETHGIVNEENDDELNQNSGICINAREDEDDDEPRRRGKRRKKSKQLTQMITFTPNQDPETQVATLGPDSPNQSARPSLIPDEKVPTTKFVRKSDDFLKNVPEKSFFLDEESLKILRLGLSVEIVEEVFERYRHRALQEALKTIPADKLGCESDAVREARELLNLPEVDHQKWVELPRKYSRSAARFELPIDIKELSRLSVIEYLSKYVYLSSDKKQLYHRVFDKYLPVDKTTREDNENDDNLFGENSPINFNSRTIRRNNHAERFLPIDSLNTAMKEVLGFHGTVEKINEVRDLLNISESVDIDYRTFCGIIALSERYILNTKLNQSTDDPRDEIEFADFESLDKRTRNLEISESLWKILNIVRMY